MKTILAIALLAASITAAQAACSTHEYAELKDMTTPDLEKTYCKDGRRAQQAIEFRKQLLDKVGGHIAAGKVSRRQQAEIDQFFAEQDEVVSCSDSEMGRITTILKTRSLPVPICPVAQK